MLYNIQILRGFAAILVAFHHTIIYQQNKNIALGFYEFFMGWGQIGLDIFFVVSGFIIFYTQSKNPKSTLQFIKNRAIRIVPLYWFLTIMAFLLANYVPSLFTSGWMVSNVWLIKSLTFLSTYLDGAHPIIYLGWSLEYEMFFYLIFSFCILLNNKIYQLLGTFFVLLILFKIESFTLIHHYDQLFFEFVLGMMVAFAYQNFKMRNLSVYFFYAFIVFFVIITLSIDFFQFSPSNRINNWGFISALLILVSVYTKHSNSKGLVYLGAASYSIYLTQFFSIPLFYKLTKVFEINYIFWPIFCLFFVTIFGLVTYFVVEKNLTIFFRKILNV